MTPEENRAIQQFQEWYSPLLASEAVDPTAAIDPLDEDQVEVGTSAVVDTFLKLYPQWAPQRPALMRHAWQTQGEVFEMDMGTWQRMIAMAE